MKSPASGNSNSLRWSSTSVLSVVSTMPKIRPMTFGSSSRSAPVIGEYQFQRIVDEQARFGRGRDSVGKLDLLDILADVHPPETFGRCHPRGRAAASEKSVTSLTSVLGRSNTRMSIENVPSTWTSPSQVIRLISGARFFQDKAGHRGGKSELLDQLVDSDVGVLLNHQGRDAGKVGRSIGSTAPAGGNEVVIFVVSRIVAAARGRIELVFDGGRGPGRWSAPAARCCCSGFRPRRWDTRRRKAQKTDRFGESGVSRRGDQQHVVFDRVADCLVHRLAGASAFWFPGKAGRSPRLDRRA